MRIDSSGNVGIGTEAPNEQLEITGNFRLPGSSTTAGVIYAGGTRFINNYGTANAFLGLNSGNLTHGGSAAYNTGIGENALDAITKPRKAPPTQHVS